MKNPYLESNHALWNDGKPNGLGYFGQSTPVCFSEQGSYANPTANSVQVAHYWSHGLGEIVTSLFENGLQIEYLHELLKVVETAQVLVCQAEGGYEAQLVQNLLIPHSFSIRAIKRADSDI